MKQSLFSNAVGSLVYFLIIHLLFKMNTLPKDLFSSIIFFVLMMLISWFIQKRAVKKED
ncbi:hypothetical protein LQZ24_02790 [Fructobacillus sp. M1-13]|uniref:Bacteriocin immunity protein n=1 Tax=Fructobacillus papyriferae TaxID=2713171 RepID=A0ABS5QRC1_9LACO|nr:hypothetical protein [Fructobacillus papyriferae]MBS9335372.1 hypothetical protein [Fructobacillus papyriferae]MCD2158958.1 hypothetical protein [Fructobacillus papyriferae]